MYYQANAVESLSARRAWIEIDFSGSAWVPEFTSLSARRAWIEIRLTDMSAAWNRSLSARRAWIEIGRALRQLQLALRRSPQGERG